MIDKDLYDAIVIGGGPAGLTAAMYLARACYRVLVVEKEKFGGQITITAEVVNYPGATPQSGEELTEKMRKQAESFGAEFMLADVTELDFSNEVKVVKTSRGDLRALGILLATGAHPRQLGFEGEEEFKGHGVAYCATCDGEFYTGKEVFVVGGGFAAAEEAVFLTRYASHVTMLVCEDDFTCAKEVADKARENKHITILTNTEVVSAKGDSVLRTLIYKNNKTGEIFNYEASDGDTFGIFVFAGYVPSTDLVKGIAQLNPQGYVITDESKQTTMTGLYAAGDVCIKPLRQVVTATGDGAIAATEMEKYLSKQREITGLSTTMPVKRASVHQEKPQPKASNNELLDEAMKQQLNAVFEKMTETLTLEMYLDEREVSQELQAYMQALSSLTDKLIIREGHGQVKERPYVQIRKANGEEAGFTFHGAPGGHEFTSFVLTLYNMASSGQPIDPSLKSTIESINKDVHMTIMVSLSCTMCPDLVVAAGRLASLNKHIHVDVYDLNHFTELKDKYHVMSVPCFIINDQQPEFGKKNVEQLTSLIMN